MGLGENASFKFLLKKRFHCIPALFRASLIVTKGIFLSIPDNY